MSLHWFRHSTSLAVAVVTLYGCTTVGQTEVGKAAASSEIGAFRKIVFDVGGRYVAAHEAARNNLYVFSATDLSKVSSLPLRHHIDSLMFSPDASNVIIDASAHDVIYIWIAAARRSWLARSE